MEEIRCFIASAFDKEDIDAIYDNSIVPTLKGLNIFPQRVDKIDHNDDVDDKIMELMNTCDFCIADLTYARPSVYYEAGYFMGLGKPVIFTTRRDHFRPNIDDKYGNFRVHFDLQMKNIIAWSSIKEIKTFSKRLKSRIELILKPIVNMRDEIMTKSLAEENFIKLSMNARIQLIEQETTQKWINAGWSLGNPRLLGYTQPSSYPVLKKGKDLIAIFISSSATLAFLKYVETDRVISQNIELLNDGDNCHIVIFSVRSVPQSRIDDMYPNISKLAHGSSSYRAPGMRIQRNEFSGEIQGFYHIYSNLKSELDVEDAYNSISAQFSEI